MSISLYTGTPGSGKSFHAAKDIEHRMRRGGTLICNFPVNTGFVKKCRAQVEYWDNSELTAERLVAYALEHHKIGKEGQALVVIDECQIIFNYQSRYIRHATCPPFFRFYDQRHPVPRPCLL